MFRKAIATLLAMMLLVTLPSFTYATEAVNETATLSIKEVRTQMGDHTVAYPQIEGMADAAIQKKINDDIVLSADIASHFVTLATLKNSPWGLVVEHQSFLTKDVLSTVISAKGKQPTGRDGHAYTALSYDLATGERLTLEDIVTDVNAAVSLMEKLAEATVELSDYMENGNLLPLPIKSFAINQNGITFYYPATQFLLLSGYSGACQFYYEELGALLRTDTESIPSRIGALPNPVTDAEAKTLIEKAVTEGILPHVPATLGEKMGEIVAKYRLVRTPDEFPGGRYFTLEDPAFRQVLLISDAMESGYDNSVLEGIQIKRGSLYGLIIDSTKQVVWRKILGEPVETISFTENMAYDYNLPIGQSDRYSFGMHELRLHANEDGVLVAIQLSR